MSALGTLISTAGKAGVLDSLDFTLPDTSSAITNRKLHVRAFPMSASTLALTGTRTCRIRLGGDDFIDPSSVRLMFTVTAGASLTPIAGPWGVWGQVYLSSSGTELDNIPFYGRFHHERHLQLSRPAVGRKVHLRLRRQLACGGVGGLSV